MATVTSVVTLTAGQWKYVAVDGTEHTVTTSQTFNLTIDDNSTTDVHYYFVSPAQTVTTTDGYKLTLRGHTHMGQVGSNSNANRTVGPFTDAGQGSPFYGLRGEFIIECPITGMKQRWKPLQINPSDADFGGAGTITLTLEDQFGHVMNMPFQLSGTISVAQAA